MKTIATGENGNKPKAFIWDSVTGQKIHELIGHGIMKTIVAMAYSSSGKHLLLVCGADDHEVAVYDTQSGACVAEGKSCREAVIEAVWEDDQSFVLVGAKLYL